MPQDPTTVTVVETPACHYCQDAARALAILADRFPLTVHTVEVDSPQGRELVARHRPALAPLVLVDGAFFSSGRLPRRKLEKLLAQRASVPGPTRVR